jgi:repressor LexA
MNEKRTAETAAPAAPALSGEDRRPLPCTAPTGLPGSSGRGHPRPDRALPLAGEVRAGFPSPAEEELRDLLSFDEYLVPFPDASFLVQARDDSMTGEGIRKGDLVIIERGRVPRHGDVVLAEADGAWILRYFCRERGRVVLRTADPKDPPVVPRTELRLGGVVTAVVRKYHK